MKNRNRFHATMVALGKRWLWQAQQRMCGLCGQPITEEQLGFWIGEEKATLDHVWPTSLLPVDTSQKGNTMIAHDLCNNRKANRPPRACEVLFLFAVNRALGYDIEQTMKFDDPLILDKPVPVLRFTSEELHVQG